MKLFGLFGKQKAVPFTQFRDMVRSAARRSNPGANAVISDTGFVLIINGQKRECNLRQLYNDYCKNPGNGEDIIQTYVDALVSEVPEHGWVDARPTLRLIIKDAATLEAAKREMLKNKSQDSLAAEPFVGDLFVTVAREVVGTVTYVTQVQLEKWGVIFEQAIEEAKNNMNMLSFPPITNEMRVGGSGKRGANDGDVVGVVFEGDHLTATWLVLERFRDFLGMKLQGDYVVFVPHRSRLEAVRVDEPGLISSLQQKNRNFRNQPYSLTSQGFLVSVATTGGQVSVYKGSESVPGLAANSPFAAGSTKSSLPNLSDAASDTYTKPLPVDLSSWGGLSEPTGDASHPSGGSGSLGKGKS